MNFINMYFELKFIIEVITIFIVVLSIILAILTITRYLISEKVADFKRRNKK